MSLLLIFVTGGLCFAYNCDLFYRVIFPHLDLGGWLFFVTFVVGGIGVLVGGYISDKAVANMGIKSRVIVLALSQVCYNMSHNIDNNLKMYNCKIILKCYLFP